MSSVGSFYSQGSPAKDLAPRFRLKHSPSRSRLVRRTSPTPVYGGDNGPAERGAPDTSALSVPGGRRNITTAPANSSSRTLFSLGSSRSPSTLARGGGATLRTVGSRGNLYSASGSKRRLNQLLQVAGGGEASDGSNALPLRTLSPSGSSHNILGTSPSFRARRHGNRSFSPPKHSPLTRGTRGSSPSRDTAGVWSPRVAAIASAASQYVPKGPASSGLGGVGSASTSSLLDYGVGGAQAKSVLVNPTTPRQALTVGKKRAVRKLHRDNSVRSSTREVFGFRPN